MIFAKVKMPLVKFILTVLVDNWLPEKSGLFTNWNLIFSKTGCLVFKQREKTSSLEASGLILNE